MMKVISLLLAILCLTSPSQSEVSYKIGNIQPSKVYNLFPFGGPNINQVGVKFWTSDHKLYIYVDPGVDFYNIGNSSIFVKNRVEFYWFNGNSTCVLTVTPEKQKLLTKADSNSLENPGCEIELPLNGVDVATNGNIITIIIPESVLGFSVSQGSVFGGDLQVVKKDKSWSFSSWYSTLVNPEKYITFIFDNMVGWDSISVGKAKTINDGSNVIIYGVTNYPVAGSLSIQDLWQPLGLNVVTGITPTLSMGELIYAKGNLTTNSNGEKIFVISDLLKRETKYIVPVFNMTIETIDNIQNGKGVYPGPITIKCIGDYANGQITSSDKSIKLGFDFTEEPKDITGKMSLKAILKKDKLDVIDYNFIKE